jgi:micrococcal nuclease
LDLGNAPNRLELKAFLAACGLMTLGAAAAAPARACLGAAFEAPSAEVVDARSLRMADGRTLRLAGIEPFSLIAPDLEDAEEALKAALDRLAGDGPLRVTLLSEDADRYGRLPALIATGTGTLAQGELLRAGLALAFATGDPFPCFTEMLAAEDAARQNRRGFWASGDLPPARADALKPLIGRFAIFQGRVISVGSRRARTYLNFGTWWAQDVTVEIEAGDRERFGGDAELQGLTGRRVRVRGFIEDRAGPAVLVSSPMQVEALDAPREPEGSAP